MRAGDGARAATRRELRELAQRAWEAAIRRVEPAAAVERVVRLENSVIHAGEHRVPLPTGRLVVLAFGKATQAMLAGLDRALPGRIREGLAVTKDGHGSHAGHGATPGAVRLAEAAHPVPDERGARLGREMLELARTLGEDDLAIVLVSGGASALLASPLEGLELSDLIAVTDALLRSGADIHEMNAVRKHLSAIHGGRLAEALGACPSLTLYVSDVPGDDPSSISSGPTVADETTWEAVRDIVSRRIGGGAPARVAALVEAGIAGDVAETPSRLDERHRLAPVATNRDAVLAAVEALASEGFCVEAGDEAVTGEVCDEATRLLEELALLEHERAAVVHGGETTLVVDGDGLGGRNQHLAASAARTLDAMARDGVLEACEIVLAAIGTDGNDGPTDAAGALIDSGSWARARAAGVDPTGALARCDSHRLLGASNDLVRTGPTGTNVTDLYLVLRAGLGGACPGGPEE